MTTKKQMRARLERKREIELADTIRSGLVAQNKDKERRKLIAEKQAQKKAEEDLKKAHEKAKAAMVAVAEKTPVNA